MIHTTGGAFAHPEKSLGNSRRWRVLQIIRSMLKSPRMGSRWECHDWVFLSGRELSEWLNCNRKTADAELAWLTEQGFLVREKLGGKAIKPSGTRVALGNRSWFYRLGDAVAKFLPWWVGQSSARSVPSPRPVTGQSVTDHPSSNHFPRGEQAPKTEQPEQPLTGKDELQQAREACAAVLQAPDQQPTANQREQRRIAEENRQRKEREEIAAGHRTPEGGSTIPEWMKGWKKGDPIPGIPQQPALGFGAT